MLKSSSYSNVFSLFLNSSFLVDQEVREAHAIPSIQVTLWTKCHLHFYFRLMEHKEACPS